MRVLPTGVAVLFSAALALATPIEKLAVTADAAALQSAQMGWGHAIRDKNLDEVVSAYTGDAIVVSADGKRLDGSDAIRSFYTALFQDQGYALDRQLTHADITGSLAYTFGTFRQAGKHPADGHYLTVWQRQAGETWKIAVDTLSSAPAAGAVAK